MAVTVSSLPRVRKRVGMLLNLLPDDLTYSIEVSDQGKYTKEGIRDACLEGDALVCLDIIDTEDHPFRNTFLGNVPSSLTYGQAIPAHIGKRAVVEIQYDDSTWKPGIEATNLDQILRMARHPGIYEVSYCQGRYFIHREQARLYFIGSAGRVWTPAFIIDRISDTSEGACQSPEIYERSVILRSLECLLMDGGDMTMFEFYAKQSANHQALIRSGASAVPEIVPFKQAGA